MKLKIAPVLFLAFFLIFVSSAQATEELPIPTYANSIIISIEHPATDSDQVDYIKNNFNFGLYAWLSFSRTAYTPSLEWHSNWNEASNGIQSFMSTIDSLITAAKEKEVKLHIVLCSGLARGLSTYNEAKLEDIRNCQWYSDNLLAQNDPTLSTSDFDTYVFGTLSRYARKMRANVEAKAKAVLAFLKQRMDENPGTLIALSGWGEAEYNYRRINHSKSLQDYFCDYSPFTVLEFRDWIQHTGMYDNTVGKYKGEGYSGGGTKYQGPSGLNQFNAEFGTDFTTWDLKYFNWSLDDDWDLDPTDSINNDPHRIPSTEYIHGSMMNSVGALVTQGGFDPPRTMEYPSQYPGESQFWALWNLFRETVVKNFITDMAKWSYEAGIDPNKWYSHQIPADYLFGTHPGLRDKNARYYTSASPLWTANNLPYGSVGATIYDIKFPVEVFSPEFARTTKYCVPAISQMSSNWAALEFDPETYPTGLAVSQSQPEFILEQYYNLYNYNCHLINFWRWMYDPEHNIKGSNKEIAVKDFINGVRDKGRNQNLNNPLAPPDFTYSPPKPVGFSGQYMATSGAVSIAEASGIQINIDKNIWSGHNWEWKDWGDFDHFEIHRSLTQNFDATPNTFLASTSDYVYSDTSVAQKTAYFYKIRAVNSKGAAGPYSDEKMLLPSSSDVPVLHVDKDKIIFAVTQAAAASTSEDVAISNIGVEATTLYWSASSNQYWLSVSPESGTEDGILKVNIDTSTLNTGIYQGQVRIEDPNAFNSPHIIEVTTVINGADISLSSTSILFGQKTVGESCDAELLIENNGSLDLTISKIEKISETATVLTSTNVFSVVSFPTTITPGGSDKAIIRFTPKGNKSYSANFKIFSDDPDEPEVVFNATGDGLGKGNIVLSKNRFSFGAEVDGTAPHLESVVISNSGNIPLQWQATKTKEWIGLNITSGSDNKKLEISVNPSGLAEGTHNGEVNITDPDAENSPKTIEVVLKIFAVEEENPPFGSFDTPVDGTTVSGSVPFTGWVIDNIGIDKVELKRDPVEGDSLGSIGTDGLIYIGQAVFVKGARPDVEDPYSDFPKNDHAGWGYMMLTNFLPNQGNGTFTFHAIVTDAEGNVVDLGSKTIICDNVNATTPFGTIDTPGQGEKVSGLIWNSGWALTPQPSKIPEDGSTIWVWIDGLPVGHPIYNQYREDIATLFPGYQNSNGAVGAFLLDTTLYVNGVHTIAWSVRDNSGGENGIGSRFFEIENLEGEAAAQGQFGFLKYRESSNPNLRLTVDGTTFLQVEETGRVVLKLNGTGGHRFFGWGTDETKPLPIGSTLDSKNGVFYWTPGPGFLGEHILHFAVSDGVSRSQPVMVVVNIGPKRFDSKRKPIKRIKNSS